MQRLVLVKCRNTNVHLTEDGEEGKYFFKFYVDSDEFEYPPPDVIVAIVDAFFEEYPEGTIGIINGECMFCKDAREDAKEVDDDNL